MKKYVLLLLTVVTATTMMAQDKVVHDPNAEKRSVSGFHAIHVEDGIDLYLSQGTEAVAVSAADLKYRAKIKTVVESGILKIFYDNEGVNISWRDRRLKAYVSVKTLDEIRASGGSDVDINGGLRAERLSLGLSGGSDFEGIVEVSDLTVRASGGSDVRIGGTTGNLSLRASGGSDFKGFDLEAGKADIDVNGGSDAQVNVTKEMSVSASGGSDVDYKGGAVIKKISSSGSSSVSKRN